MVASTCLLVLACAVAINAQYFCNDVQSGSLAGDQFALEPVNLQPGIADWNIKIPPIPQCPNGISGAKAHVCDNDAKPLSRFIDLNNLFVHRTGLLLGYANVRVIVYCNAWSPYLGQQPDSGLLPPSDNQYGQLPSQAKSLLLLPY